MGTVTYESNNSGGYWWLDDKDWVNLEASGWAVEWVKSDPWHNGAERWLGALATRATRNGLSLDDAIAEWASVTGLDPNAHGCCCCGQPHYFTDN